MFSAYGVSSEGVVHGDLAAAYLVGVHFCWVDFGDQGTKERHTIPIISAFRIHCILETSDMRVIGRNWCTGCWLRCRGCEVEKRAHEVHGGISCWERCVHQDVRSCMMHPYDLGSVRHRQYGLCTYVCKCMYGNEAAAMQVVG